MMSSNDHPPAMRARLHERRGSGAALPRREGPRPSVTSGIPHIQLDQTSVDAIHRLLIERAFEDPRVTQGPSHASLPGAQALRVAPELPARPAAMIVDREFAHIHRQPGAGSLHVRLPLDLAGDVVAAGWAVWHPFALDGTVPGLVLLFAPRHEDDLATVLAIISAATDFAVAGA